MIKHSSLARKLLSLCLAFVMLFTSVFTSVYASGYERYGDSGVETGFADIRGTADINSEDVQIQAQTQEQVQQDVQEQQVQESNQEENSDVQEQVQEEIQEQIPTTSDQVEDLQGNTFDLQKSSLYIYEADGLRYVEYGGLTYTTEESSFVLTGSTAENQASVTTDGNIEITLRDLAMDADEALTFSGNGTFDIIVDGTVVLNNENADIFLSGGLTANFLFEDKSALYAAGNIGATEDPASITINGGFYRWEHYRKWR